MDRNVYALVTASLGRNSHRQFKAHAVESYLIDSSMDNDVDSLSVDIGDPTNEYGFLLNRDTEVRMALFSADSRGRYKQLFSGIGDTVNKTSDDHTLSVAGRDMSSLALGDAPPGKWRHVKPRQFITDRALALGFPAVKAHAMDEISPLYTDGSETEWAFWYRMARKRGMWMWTGPNGALWIGKLGYSLATSYSFGRGRGDGWVMPKRVSITKDTAGRVGEVWVYWNDNKANRGSVARGIDTTIRAWRRLPVKIIASSTAKSQVDAKKEADTEVFESIVGAFEIELTLHDTGALIEQNKMCRVNIPELELVGTFFVVGVSRRGGMDGMEQVVRLRQKTFAMSERVPQDPKLAKPDEARNAVPASMASQLEAMGSALGVRWADHFVRATNEFGVPAGWDFAVFLGVLLAICEKESTFRNVKQGHTDQEWMTWAAWQTQFAGDAPHGHTTQAARTAYEAAFSNKGEGIGVGPMQLTSQGYKDWADEYGWNSQPKHDEYEGGRWNPASNIRAAARALVEKLKAAPSADPSQASNIWIGVQRYNGGGNQVAYMKDVKRRFDDTFGALAEGVVAASAKRASGTNTTATVTGHGKIEAMPSSPDIVKKAINWCEQRLGDPYKWGGRGPYYDCSGLVSTAYYQAGLRTVIPANASGQETTYTLYRKGRFQAVSRDALLSGDLVFFDDEGGGQPGHVGMYVNDGIIIHDPHTGDVVKWTALADFGNRYMGARRLVQWYGTSTADQPTDTQGSTGVKRVMIQAGHDPGSHADQPYGHEGQSGAVGELDFTLEVRDKVLAMLDSDPRFKPTKGTAWSASAGATASAGDDIDYSGDLFISVHYDKGTAGSGFFFGYTRGATDSRPANMSTNSARLADKVAARMNDISGHPPRLADNSTFGGTPANATGWGYYAWGSSLRAAPDDVNHLPGIDAALVMECGRASDASFLDNQRGAIAKAIYRGICDYYAFKAV